MEYLYMLQQALVWIITIFWIYQLVISICSLVKLKEKPIIEERKYAEILACFKATDVIDGDISEKIKIESIDTSSNSINSGIFPVELSVTNSCGDTVYLESTVTLIEGEETQNE